MIKKIVFILLCSTSLLSCVQEKGLSADAPGKEETDGQKVTVSFSIPGYTPGTKALNEGGVLNSLHLAIFGSSGYLKEYVEAIPSADGTYEYQAKDNNDEPLYYVEDDGGNPTSEKTTQVTGHPVMHVVPKYSFKATVSLSDGERSVHFIGNGPATIPFGFDTKVMPSLLSANGDMGYWQMITLSSISAVQVNGRFIDKYGDVIEDGEGIYPDDYPVVEDRGKTRYVADEATERAFNNNGLGIPLIRNWSKIVLRAEEDSNFTPISLAVVNVPTRGAIVPYSGKTQFISNYQDRSFLYLENEIQYPGNLPPGTLFDATVPSAEAFSAPFGEGVADAAAGEAVYLYERPAPTNEIPPSFVIIYGHYDNPEDVNNVPGDYFYKVDLMESRQETVDGETQWNSFYYPIYRNFKYQIIVKKILSQGHSTPAAAAASAGSADVSADITTGSLSDISDGVGRLHVTWMSKAFTKSHGPDDPVNDLHAWFSSTSTGEPDMSPASEKKVTVTLLPADDGGSDIISNLAIGDPSDDTGSKGWRPITFQTAAPGKTVRSQSIRITGTHEFGRLYRDVSITIQPIQPMTVSCKYPSVEPDRGSSQEIIISIPDGLGESMFPLDFTIEAERMTLTPDNTSGDNLPVSYGASISENEGFEGKSSFQFIRTLTWEEYTTLSRYEDDDEFVWRNLNCHFITNRDDSATTVWVYNEFFDKASTSFNNFVYHRFRDLGFNEAIPEQADQPVTLSFKMGEPNEQGIWPEILIMVRGLVCTTEGIDAGPVNGSYLYRPGTKNVTLSFETTDNDADIAVDLSAEDYEDAHVESYRFPYASFLDGHLMRSNNEWNTNIYGSNVAWGYINQDNKKNVIFAYKDHPDKLNTKVTLTLTNLNCAVAFPNTPTGPRNEKGDSNYHEYELTSVGGLADAELVLSSPGYITKTIRAGRFKGNIRSMLMNKNNAFASNSILGNSPYEYTYEQDGGKVKLSFDDLPVAPDGKLTLPAGGTYTMTITSLNSNQTLFYVNVFFKTENNKVLAPATITPSVGTMARYFGSNNQYVWNIPRGYKTVNVTFEAPADSDIIITDMYVKAFNGSLYENGQPIP